MLPVDGAKTSVETALNSRCSSDSDGVQSVFHWGMFSPEEKLTEVQISKIIEFSKIPGFTGRKIDILSKENLLTCIVDNKTTGSEKEKLMIESGMQQQAVALVCAALGVGNVIKNLGMNGTEINENDFAAVSILVNPMKPSFNGQYWTKSSIHGRKAWKKGNLPDPDRDGSGSLLSVISELQLKKDSDIHADINTIGQLLWAAKGRTPHLYKSKPWGMTIPVWTDKKENTTVYMADKDRLYKYINWKLGRPTHAIEEIGKIDIDYFRKLLPVLQDFNSFIVIGSDDDNNRGYWEVGYELLNILLQAKSLQIKYHACFIEADSRQKVCEKYAVKKPVVIIGV